MTAQITDFDLHAYVDGFLDKERIQEVEDFLRADQEATARAAAYLHQKEEIQRYLDRCAAPPSATTAALENRLSRRLLMRGHLRHLRRAAAAAALLWMGWFVNDLLPGSGHTFAQLQAPNFVDEAAEAHALVASAGWSVSDMVSHDTGRVAAIAGWRKGEEAALPEINRRGFAYLGAMPVPWDEGTAVQLVYRDIYGDPITIFVAARSESGETVMESMTLDGRTFVYWQKGGFAYAVGGEMSRDRLLDLARSLAETIAR